MGCDQSRQKDLDETRQRSRTNAGIDGGNGASNVSSPPMGIANGGAMSPKDHGMAQSYTDQRLNEDEFYNEIINNTADRLIKTADVVDSLATRDVTGRMREYSALVVQHGTVEDGAVS